MHLAIALVASSTSYASSHREAPAISKDPAADLTDFYAFIDPGNANKAIFIMNVNPLEDPGGGPNFHSFDDKVRYEVRCDNEGDGLEDVILRFEFTTTYQYPDTFLYNVGDVANPANVNSSQTYTVRKIVDGVGSWIVPPTAPVSVAPNNVGFMSNPGTEYKPFNAGVGGSLTTSNIHVAGNYRFFAGPRQDGFYVDLERTFDLLNLGGGGNLNTLLGKNVHSIAMSVPVADLTKDGLAPTVNGQNNVIACWSTTSRHANRTYNTDGTQNATGPWVQISRLGNPLVNEGVIPVGQKDLFNASAPSGDGQFLESVIHPLLITYMNALLGVPDPGSYDDPAVPNTVVPQPARDDLVLVYLTGHPAVGNLPGGFALGGAIPGEPGKTFGAFEALRINLANPVSSFPNGRYVADDVVDTTLSALAGLLIPGNGTIVPDGVDSTGLHYLGNFPFMGDPWAGDSHPANHH